MTGSRTATCNCGAVRITVTGEPLRVGLCHCTECRKETGSPFLYFGDWDASQVVITGATSAWHQPNYSRHFCPSCGSRMFATARGVEEIEIRLGTFDEAPTGLTPDYELFVDRREPWLAPFAGTEQHAGNRPSDP